MRSHLYRRNEPLTLDAFRSGAIEGPGGCWLWQRGTQRGYGVFGYGGKQHRAHRIAWMLANGPIPDGMTVDHICFQTACINPDHLRLLSNEENARRQRSALSAFCKRGHELTPENTWTRPNNGRRACKTCQRQRIAARRASA